MIPRLMPSLAAFALAFPLHAAQIDDRYEIMGTMTVEMEAETLDLVIPFDLEDDQPNAEQTMIMEQFHTINALGRRIDDSGMPGLPMVQVTLQKRMGEMELLSAEMFDDQGYDAPMVMGADGGDGAITEISLEDDRLEATVEGAFLRLTGYTSKPVIAEGAVPVPATITWQVDLPPME